MGFPNTPKDALIAARAAVPQAGQPWPRQAEKHLQDSRWSPRGASSLGQQKLGKQEEEEETGTRHNPEPPEKGGLRVPVVGMEPGSCFSTRPAPGLGTGWPSTRGDHKATPEARPWVRVLSARALPPTSSHLSTPSSLSPCPSL